jgi:hypothetical protein
MAELSFAATLCGVEGTKAAVEGRDLGTSHWYLATNYQPGPHVEGGSIAHNRYQAAGFCCDARHSSYTTNVILYFVWLDGAMQLFCFADPTLC